MNSAMIFALLWGPARAGDLAVGWSDLNDPMVADVFLGGEPAVGYRQVLSGLISLEGRLSYSPDTGVNRASDLTNVLVIIAENGSSGSDFQQPLVVNTWRVELLADIGPARARDRLQGVPHLRAGFGLEGQNSYYAVYDSSVAEGEAPVALRAASSGFGVPVIAEFTHELWGARGFGIRMSAGILAEVRDEPQYDPDEEVTEKVLYTRPRIGIDLLFDVGGER